MDNFLRVKEIPRKGYLQRLTHYIPTSTISRIESEHCPREFDDAYFWGKRPLAVIVLDGGQRIPVECDPEDLIRDALRGSIINTEGEKV